MYCLRCTFFRFNPLGLSVLDLPCRDSNFSFEEDLQVLYKSLTKEFIELYLDTVVIVHSVDVYQLYKNKSYGEENDLPF